MTQLLVTLVKDSEFISAIAYGADILDIPLMTIEKPEGFLKRVSLFEKTIKKATTVSLSQLVALQNYENSHYALFDFFRVDMAELQREEDWQTLQQLSSDTNIVLLANHQYVSSPSWEGGIERAKIADIYGVILTGFTGNILYHHRKNGMIQIKEWISEIKKNGLLAGIAGELEEADIVRILPSSIDIIEYSLAAITKIHKTTLYEETTPGERLGNIASLLSSEININQDEIKMSRILISDFILPMFIGAYRAERSYQQRVCFNVAADIVSFASCPETMSHIFSYDIILDEIRNIAASGHIEFVETIAEKLADFILSHSQVRSVTVRVEKLDLGPAAVGIEITRSKNK